MDWTDRHCRVFHRGLTRRALVYTEMVTSGASCCMGIASGCWGSIAMEASGKALQLGGSDPHDLGGGGPDRRGFGL